MRHSAYGFGQLKALDHDELRKKAASIFAVEASTQTSGRYEFIPTSAVVDGLKKKDGCLSWRKKQR